MPRIMRLILATIVLLTTAAVAWGQDDAARQPAPQAIQVAPLANHGEVIPLLADVPDGAETAWAVIPTPGGLSLILAVSTPDGVTILSHVILVGPRPPPIDPPDPTPPGPDPPEPTPVSSLEVWIVEETADRTPEQARVLLSTEWRSHLKDNGHSLRLTDQDAPTAPVTLPGELPAVLGFISGRDEAVFRAPLPDTGVGLLKLVKGWAK